jgi:hypothetical protein
MATQIQTFWQKNQVVISAIVSAVTLVLQQFMSNAEAQIDFKALGLATLVAVAGVIGNQFRGKGVTVAGFLGVAGYAFYTIQSTGHFTGGQFILSLILGLLALISPPPKNETYEQSPTIQTAKTEAKIISQDEKENK